MALPALRFDLLPAPAGGRLLLSPHPAAVGATAQALAAYRQARARLLVSLVAADELAALGLARLAADCAAHDLAWAHCPIEDMTPPGESFERAWTDVGPRVHALLDRGEAVALHCRAGLGRTGTIAARILLERGLALDEAVAAVRRARPGTIETRTQEAYLEALAARLRG